MLRPAKPQDIDAIVRLAVESVTTVSPIEELVIDEQAMAETARQCLQPAHFMWVSEVDGEVVGALAAQVVPGFWFKKLQCSVLLHYATIPGEWVKLMREFARWVKSRSGIKLAIIELEDVHGDDPRMLRFIQRLGFDRQSQNLTYVRRSQ